MLNLLKSTNVNDLIRFKCPHTHTKKTKRTNLISDLLAKNKLGLNNFC